MGLLRNQMNKKNCSGYDESTNAKVPSGIKKKRNFEEEEHAAFASKKPRRKRKLDKLSKDKGQKTMVSSSKCPDADVKRKQVRENLVEALSKVYGENNDETMKEQLRACVTPLELLHQSNQCCSRRWVLSLGQTNPSTYPSCSVLIIQKILTSEERFFLEK